MRDLEGLPVVGALVGAIPADEVAFRWQELVETDAEGRFDLEIQIAVSDDTPAAIETFAAYLGSKSQSGSSNGSPRGVRGIRTRVLARA